MAHGTSKGHSAPTSSTPGETTCRGSGLDSHATTPSHRRIEAGPDQPKDECMADAGVTRMRPSLQLSIASSPRGASFPVSPLSSFSFLDVLQSPVYQPPTPPSPIFQPRPPPPSPVNQPRTPPTSLVYQPPPPPPSPVYRPPPPSPPVFEIPPPPPSLLTPQLDTAPREPFFDHAPGTAEWITETDSGRAERHPPSTTPKRAASFSGRPGARRRKMPEYLTSMT